ncbi:UNVERIFIED_CONTAM: hypothetical protein GTU68_035129 [Idotea baltica]|nr:hypothetical protein [Idotea baltica]
MWSGPRNISTALMRSFENRLDSSVIDEPLYGYYLKSTGFIHPGRDEIIASMDCDWRSVADHLSKGVGRAHSVFYQKLMTQHMLPEVELDFSDSLKNCFLIREPRRIIASYCKVRPQFTLEELGFPQQWQLFQRVVDRTGRIPPVIDSAAVLKAPEENLRALCTALDLEFSSRMLHWPAGERDSDGVWAPHWYDAVRCSTGFEEIQETPLEDVRIPAQYESLCEQADRIYQDLYPHALVGG